MQLGVLQDPKSQRRHNFEKSVGSRSLEGSSTLGRLGLEGLLLFVYPNLLSSGSIYRLEGDREIFAEFFSLLFDNTSSCYLVLAFLFPYSCALLLLFVVHVYALEQYQLIAIHLLLFRTQISQSKINLAIILIRGLNKLLCFNTFSSFQLQT